MRTLATRLSKRQIAGSLILLFWIGLGIVQGMPLSVEAWVYLVPLRCPLAWIFGIQCPTCGLGRALIAAALGHGQESLRYHPLGLPLFWGSQSLLLCWMFWPRGWVVLRQRWLEFYQRRKLLLGFLILIYSIWGFCWREQI